MAVEKMMALDVEEMDRLLNGMHGTPQMMLEGHGMMLMHLASRWLEYPDPGEMTRVARALQSLSEYLLAHASRR